MAPNPPSDSGSRPREASSSNEGVTIHDVAAMAGVSASTVSNVLNGKQDRMRADTYDRVMEAVNKLGYSPNQMARSLKTGFVPIVGLIVPSVENPFWAAFARFAEHEARARNCQVLLCNSERDPAREQRYAETMLTLGIRGLILGSAPLSLNHIQALVDRGLNVVAFDRHGDESIRLDSVRVDNTLGTRLAIEHLIKLGHRRIAFASGPLNSASRVDRFESYKATLAAKRLKLDEELIWLGTSQLQSADAEATEVGWAAARAMLRLPKPPTAFFTINDMTAVGVYAGVREHGLRIPQDVSVVGFDDIPLCNAMNPPLSTVHQPVAELMHQAVDFLLSRLDGSRKGPPTQAMLEPQLVLRGSTAAVAVAG